MSNHARVAAALAWLAFTALGHAAPIQPPAATEDESPEQARPPEIRAAIEQFEQGDVNGAFERLKASAADHPQLPPPRIMLANLFFSSGNLAAGRLALEQAAVEHPDDPETYLILGDLLIRERRWTEADAVYERAATLITKLEAKQDRSRHLEARFCSGQASVAEGRGQWESAAKLLTRWIQLAPASSTAHQRCGRALFMLKREKEAFAEFQAADKDDDGPPAPIMMAMLFQQAGKVAKAEDWIQYALDRAPEDFRTQIGAAQWNWDAGRLDGVARHAAAALKLNAESLDALLLSAQAAYYQGSVAEAERQLETLSEKSPGNFNVVNLLALLLADSDEPTKLQRGLELAALNSERFPDSAEAATTLAWALFRNDKKGESRASLQRIKANSTLSRDAAYRAARMMHDGGQTELAIELVDGALASTGPFAAEAGARAWRATLTPR